MLNKMFKEHSDFRQKKCLTSLSSDVLYKKNRFVTANWILQFTANVFRYLVQMSRVAVTYRSFEVNWIFHFVSVAFLSVAKRDITKGGSASRAYPMTTHKLS